MNRLPHAIFSGLFLAALSLGVLEACHLAIYSRDELPFFSRLLSVLYVMSPFVLTGFVFSSIGYALSLVWVRTKRTLIPKDQDASRIADIATTLITTVIFILLLFSVARLTLTMDSIAEHRGFLLAILTPATAIGSVYVWVVIRQQLGRLESRLGTWSTLAVTLGLLGLATTFPVRIIGKNDALADFLGGAPALFVVIYPTLAVALISWFSSRYHKYAPSFTLRRSLFIVGLLSATASMDLVYRLDETPGVKMSLLQDTLVFKKLIMISQPLFDRDGDGYSGLLGGGDCDDTSADIHPGASEIPRNGVDDDCFGGDAPGSVPPEIILPQGLPSAKARGLVDRPNIILITVDTLNPNHLGYMGYSRPTSPNIDQIAEAGLRFRWAFSQGPQTRVSIPSVFTGRYFSEVDRTNHLWATIHPSNLLLAERLKKAGYYTAGIPCHEFFFPGYGLNQGFDEWDISILKKYKQRIPYVVTGNLVSDRAVEWLEKRAAAQTAEQPPFFLWLHYFDPHFKYLKHKGINFGTTDIDRYDGEIQYTDQQLGRVLKALEKGPFADNHYLIIHSDHSEGFGLHGYKYHAQHLYNDQVHVPLIIKGPGIRSRQWDTPVSLIDIVPTVLDLAGLPKPASLPGVTLIPYGTDLAPPAHPPVFIEMLKDPTHSDRRVIIDWPWKYQFGITFGEHSLYNLSQDPNEQSNLARSRPQITARLERRLRKWMSSEVTPKKPRP